MVSCSIALKNTQGQVYHLKVQDATWNRVAPSGGIDTWLLNCFDGFVRKEEGSALSLNVSEGYSIVRHPQNHIGTGFDADEEQSNG